MIAVRHTAPLAAARSMIAVAAAAVAMLGGRIVDKTTGQPLVGVTVRIGAAKATTDAQGRYALHGLGEGSRRLTLESNDVPAEHLDITLHAGANRRDIRACSTTLDFGCGEAPAPEAGGAG